MFVSIRGYWVGNVSGYYVDSEVAKALGEYWVGSSLFLTCQKVKLEIQK